jgi:hypothetical protein
MPVDRLARPKTAEFDVGNSEGRRGDLRLLDRYAARCANFVLVVTRYSLSPA